mgnify:CR=1 FL=1
MRVAGATGLVELDSSHKTTTKTRMMPLDQQGKAVIGQRAMQSTCEQLEYHNDKAKGDHAEEDCPCQPWHFCPTQLNRQIIQCHPDPEGRQNQCTACKARIADNVTTNSTSQCLQQ